MAGYGKSKLMMTLNTSTLSQLLGDDPQTIQSFYADFLTQAKQEANTMRACCARLDYAGLAEHAHFLKTSAAAIGGEQMASLLQRLEQTCETGQPQQVARLMDKFYQALADIEGVITNEV